MKRIWIKYIVTCLLFMSVSLSINAQEFRQHWEKKVFAAYNLGGTSPFPIPAEIRKINYWKPGFGGTLAFHLTRWLDPNWGVTTGLAIDLKGMKVEAEVIIQVNSPEPFPEKTRQMSVTDIWYYPLWQPGDLTINGQSDWVVM